MAAREQELSVLAFLIRQYLDRGEQFGHALYFIDDKGSGLSGEKCLGIAERPLAPRGVLEIHIAETRAFMLGEGSFAGLPVN